MQDINHVILNAPPPVQRMDGLRSQKSQLPVFRTCSSTQTTSLLTMNWAAYPEHRCDAPPDAFDRSFYRKRLLEDATRLFKPGESEVKLLYVAKQPQYVSLEVLQHLGSPINNSCTKCY